MTEEKQLGFIEKHETATLVLICLPFNHLTGDHSKLLRPCLYMVQNYQFPFEIAIGRKIDFYLFIFSVEKK